MIGTALVIVSASNSAQFELAEDLEGERVLWVSLQEALESLHAFSRPGVGEVDLRQGDVRRLELGGDL
jgi:hypothetical protein